MRGPRARGLVALSHRKGLFFFFFLRKGDAPRRCHYGSGVLGNSRRCLDLGEETGKSNWQEKGKMGAEDLGIEGEGGRKELSENCEG